MPTEEEVLEALRVVEDPELGLSIVDLGLVYETKVENGHVVVKMTLTSPGCPAGPELLAGVREAAASLPGVKSVDVQVVWSPPWDPSMVSDDLKWFFGRY